ncbi:MAG TPA: response regulator [Bryobacteraceae bacterium]|jgi:two-component system chemotaxis response regulator CheY|nr:response regulator [Bryobacteraceae bacterium]
MALQILIVDDSPAMRSFIRRVVRLSGIEVDRYFEAANGAEALEQLAANPIDAVLTDINMPVMDGEEFVRRMRDNGPTQSTPVIVISTDATIHRIHTMQELGAMGYLQKPFGPEQLRNELDRVLGVHHE